MQEEDFKIVQGVNGRIWTRCRNCGLVPNKHDECLGPPCNCICSHAPGCVCCQGW